MQSAPPASSPHPPQGESPLLTTAEAASLLRVHPKQVYRLFPRGLPRHRVGGEWRFRRDELLAWAASRGDAGASPIRAGFPPAPPSSPHPAPASSAPSVRLGGASAGPAFPAPPLFASNGDVAVGILLEATREAADAWVGSVLADRATALGLLREGRVLAIGYHGASFPPAVERGRLARLHLVRREVGLVGRGERAPRVEDVPGARLASRPPSAGVRGTLDRALAAAGVDAATAHATARIYGSHLDVGAAVVRGEADVGIATHAWAARLGLAFTPLESEDYGVLFVADQLGRAEATRLCEVAQSRPLRERLAAEAGYDARATGSIHFDS